MFLKTLSLSIKTIVRNPINLSLALIPTLISLSFYIFLIVLVVTNFDHISLFVLSYIPNPEVAGWLGKLLAFVFILFIILLINWTHVILVGLISTPFNSLLSARVEALFLKAPVEQDSKKTFNQLFKSFFSTVKSELLKFIFIILLSFLAILLNVIPFFYPLVLVILSLLMSVQFLDYSWSRHGFKFGDCLRDLFSSFFSYLVSGLIFLIFMTIPFFNSLIPGLATTYMTILWLNKNKKIVI